MSNAPSQTPDLTQKQRKTRGTREDPDRSFRKKSDFIDLTALFKKRRCCFTVYLVCYGTAFFISRIYLVFVVLSCFERAPLAVSFASCSAIAGSVSLRQLRYPSAYAPLAVSFGRGKAIACLASFRQLAITG